MKHFSLNGRWTLFKQGDPTPIPAHVPGCVHTDLLANQLLPDPFYRDNELQQMWVGETDWRYQRAFECTPELLEHDRVLLRCHGLDTISTLRLNGVVIGQADNMHRTWEFDVKALLQTGLNTLDIDFAAPMPFARKMDSERGAMSGWVEPMRINSGAWIRKEPCNFGWDWGPKMVTSGIWRDIELVAFNRARIADVLILQDHADQRVDLTLKLSVESAGVGSLRAQVKVSYAGQVAAQSETNAFAGDSCTLSAAIVQPKLWWPNGMGEQPLYEVQVTLLDEQGAVLDTASKRIGLRTLRLERHPDAWGESFYFSCNGVPFFAKGADWIPASPYPGAVTRADYERFIKPAAEVHMNMLRAWGGGIYEDDAFFDLCDEYGITIWQDFMFACGTYPSHDAAFMANVEAEARDNVRRIRHHACLALWCGNNEIEQGMPLPDWLETMSWEDYGRLFDQLLPSLVRELSPQTDYWPGSPHNPCGDRNDFNNPNCGDSHLWAVWHGREPFEWYRTRFDRFCSEFGFQSFPEPQVVYDYTEPDDRSITSYVMEHHQRSGIGNSVIIHYMLDWFRLPTSFEATIWLSQILQAMAMKYAIEHWRRNMPRAMGALYWQLNDMWPAPSWASLDWKGNWKALHHMARRFFAPLMVSCLEDAERGTVQLYLTNDLGSVQNGTIHCTITDARGHVLHTESHAASVGPRSSACVAEVDAQPFLQAHTRRDMLIWAALEVDGHIISEDLALLSRPKHLALADPQLRVTPVKSTTEGWEVEIECSSVALYVWLELPGVALSDNFFHMRPGVKKHVFVSAQEISALRVHSLFNTYQAQWAVAAP